eukprot:GHVS01088844.1.p1 GENE.GHVS01088844.1~~GHVS01088844.1.p1  ORF type:complete len:310 (+),score=40.08 GHVS01088844.1:798-1727(+)
MLACVSPCWMCRIGPKKEEAVFRFSKSLPVMPVQEIGPSIVSVIGVTKASPTSANDPTDPTETTSAIELLKLGDLKGYNSIRFAPLDPMVREQMDLTGDCGGMTIYRRNTELPGNQKECSMDKVKAGRFLSEIHIKLNNVEAGRFLEMDGGRTFELEPNSEVVLKRMKTVPTVMVKPAPAETKEGEEEEIARGNVINTTPPPASPAALGEAGVQNGGADNSEDGPQTNPTPSVPRGGTGQDIEHGDKDEQNEQNGDKSSEDTPQETKLRIDVPGEGTKGKTGPVGKGEQNGGENMTNDQKDTPTDGGAK